MQIVHSALMIFYAGFWKNHLKFWEYKLNSSFLGSITIYWDLNVNSILRFAEKNKGKACQPCQSQKGKQTQGK